MPSMNDPLIVSHIDHLEEVRKKEWVCRHLRAGARWIESRLSGMTIVVREDFSSPDPSVTVTVKISESKDVRLVERLTGSVDTHKSR